jgi:hypothetical protein
VLIIYTLRKIFRMFRIAHESGQKSTFRRTIHFTKHACCKDHQLLSSQLYSDSEKTIARWEDSQCSFNLFLSSDGPVPGLLVFSNRLEALAQAAIIKAIRLNDR